MTDVSAPLTDPERLGALHRAGLLDSPPEEAFDRLARAAAEAAGAPVALVSIVDADRQFFKSSTSLDGIFAAERDTDLSLSLCRHAVASGRPLLLQDARSHPDFRTHQAVREGHVVAYAGYPIVLEGAHAVGTICVLDTKPRIWGAQEIEMLRSLALDAAEIVARQVAATDGKAWRIAVKAGLAEAPSAAEGAATGLSALPSYLARLDRGAPPPGERGAADAADGLTAAATFYFRQVDAFVASLGAPADAQAARQDRLRGAVVSAEAALLRAVDAFDRHRGEDAGGSRNRPIQELRDRCAEFLEAERRRSRTSLLSRRSMVGLDELERAVRASAAAEQAMRLALHNYEMQRG